MTPGNGAGSGSSVPGPFGRGPRQRPRGPLPDPWLDVLIAAAAVVVMAGPILFTNRPLPPEFTNDIWLGLVVSHTLPNGLPPTFFLNTNTADTSGVFNPVFAFYGGPLFALFGLLTDILGHSVLAALDVLVILAFSAAYGGAAWISRQCGLRGRLPHIPAIVVVSAPYFLTDLYGRGDLAEFVALSIIPLLVASTVHLVRAKSWTPGPTLLLILSVIVFTGSHNISLLWGTLVGAVALVVLAAVSRLRNLPIRRLGAVAGLIILAVMVNGWYLLPDLRLGGSTTVAKASVSVVCTFFDTPGLLFNPLRAVPSQSTTVALYVQAPVWFLGWSTVCGIWIWAKHSLAKLRKWWTALAFLLAALLLLIIETPLWSLVPPALQVIQFLYRLNGYVLLLTAALVLVSLLAVQHELGGTKRWTFAHALVVMLVGVTAISVGLGLWQEWVPESCAWVGQSCTANRSSELTTFHVLPGTWNAGNNYTDTTAPVVQVSAGRSFAFSPDLVDAQGGSLVATVDPPGGTQPFLTNIMAGPELVTIGGGIERVGRSQIGMVVVRRVEPGDGPIRVVIQTADGPSIRLGRWLSLAGLIGVGVLLAGQVFLRWHRRRDVTRGSAGGGRLHRSSSS